MDQLNETHKASLDLSPREVKSKGGRRRKPWALLALAAVVGALLLVVFQGLGDATLFFRNTDEAVAQRASLGEKRFRIQGRVVGDSITPTQNGVDFVITYNDVDVTISHLGDPPDLFQPNIPVVLEGRWAQVGDLEVSSPNAALPTDDGWFFASDRFFVKHEEVYQEEHPDRVEDYSSSDANPSSVTNP